MDKYFSLEILRRGYDYYKKGKVKEIVKVNDRFIAKVSGSEEYKVTVLLNKDNYEMECTCPYAEENNCKHMAAVLYCLKIDNLPIKENKVDIVLEDITDFQKFQKAYKKECYKLFHNRSYLHQNEIEDYISIMNNFIHEGKKYINSDIELAYEIFEFFIMEIDSADIYDHYGQKDNSFTKLFQSFKDLFKNEKIFVRFLAFIGTIYTIDSDEYYFEHKENILNLLYQYIEYDWQAKDTLILLNKLDRDKRVYSYQKNNIKMKMIYINYYFINKEKALCLAERCLDINEICDFLLNVYEENEEKQIELLEKMIYANKDYSNERYYSKLISIYKRKDKKKYLDTLNKYFMEHEKIETYHEIKKYYKKDEWEKVRKEYINQITDSKIYMDVCVEEGFYDDLIEKLKNEWIEIVNKYLKILVQHRPKEILALYKNKLIDEIDSASCRQHYQKILINFNNMLKIPNGKKELENILTYIRENYKNRKALQEEIDFYEETYL